jgi:hypothetical protein
MTNKYADEGKRHSGQKLNEVKVFKNRRLSTNMISHHENCALVSYNFPIFLKQGCNYSLKINEIYMKIRK